LQSTIPSTPDFAFGLYEKDEISQNGSKSTIPSTPDFAFELYEKDEIAQNGSKGYCGFQPNYRMCSKLYMLSYR